MSLCKIINPIIRGFSPDPSIFRVGDDYYIANSTFEWQAGVAIHHSRDLLNWHLIGHALTGKSSPKLTAINNSSGIWGRRSAFLTVSSDCSIRKSELASARLKT